jgi:alpha-tubulin suppressor-like RCC1 family protein
LDLSLTFAPSTGTNLKVVDNQGIGFITGEFSNLAQGQSVELAYNGKTYTFVANYYGGNGNDLVLEWARRRVLSWGYNQQGQLGVGGDVSANVPKKVNHTGILADKTVLSVAGGVAHGLALCHDGTVAVWGYSFYSGGVVDSSVPVALNPGSLDGKRVVAISAANRNNLALCSDGTLSSWGYGGFGQLGDGTTTSRNTPGAVDASGVLSGYSVVAISVGGTHCLALRSDGRVVAWGKNNKGQLGNGTMDSSNVPVLVRNDTGALKDKTVVAITTGYDHSLALCSDGTLAAWGNNSQGQCGVSFGTPSTPSPVIQDGVLADKTVVALSQGPQFFSVVLCSDGTMAAWGDNQDGQLGTGDSGSANGNPALVSRTGVLSGKTVVAVSSGLRASTAVCSDGSVVTWGQNFQGVLGNGSTETRSRVPVNVASNGELFGRKALLSGMGAHAHLIVAEPTEGYIAWMSEQVEVADQTDSADGDGDGLPNLMEYYLNGNPATPSLEMRPTVGTSGSDFVFSFNRKASMAGELAGFFDWSTDLIHWHPVELVTEPANGVTYGEVDEEGMEPVSIKVPMGENSRMFGRLRLNRP